MAVGAAKRAEKHIGFLKFLHPFFTDRGLMLKILEKMGSRVARTRKDFTEVFRPTVKNGRKGEVI